MFTLASHVIAIGLLAPMLVVPAPGGECRHESADDRVVAHFLDAARDVVDVLEEAFGR